MVADENPKLEQVKGTNPKTQLQSNVAHRGNRNQQLDQPGGDKTD